jgi:hypothetical protein
VIAPISAIGCRTSILRTQGRLVVYCEVKRLISSGLTVGELFVMLRPQLEAAMRDAVTRDPDSVAPQRATSVQMDVGIMDPIISISIYSPAAILAKLDEHLAWVQSTVERFVIGEVRGWLPPACR